MAVLLGGCPYKTQTPIDTPSVKINPAILGKWEIENSERDVYFVTQADSFTYKIEKRAESSKTPPVYKAYLSLVDGDIFMNLREEGGLSDGKTFFLFKTIVDPAGKKLILKEVTENITETFTSSAELKAFIKKYKDLSFFYSKEDQVFNRIN